MPDLKITDVEAIHLRLPEVRGRTDSSQDSLVVRVTTDAGIIGYGEVDSSPVVVKAVIEAPTSHLLAKGLREVLVGQNPLETGRLWDTMYQSTLYFGREGAVIQAMAGVDLALWDIKGQALGQPVWALLGGAYRKTLRAYASHMFDFEPKITARRAAEAASAGFTAVKFGWEPMGPTRNSTKRSCEEFARPSGATSMFVSMPDWRGTPRPPSSGASCFSPTTSSGWKSLYTPTTCVVTGSSLLR